MINKSSNPDKMAVPQNDLVQKPEHSQNTVAGQQPGINLPVQRQGNALGQQQMQPLVKAESNVALQVSAQGQNDINGQQPVQAQKDINGLQQPARAQNINVLQPAQAQNNVNGLQQPAQNNINGQQQQLAQAQNNVNGLQQPAKVINNINVLPQPQNDINRLQQPAQGQNFNGLQQPSRVQNNANGIQQPAQSQNNVKQQAQSQNSLTGQQMPVNSKIWQQQQNQAQSNNGLAHASEQNSLNKPILSPNGQSSNDLNKVKNNIPTNQQSQFQIDQNSLPLNQGQQSIDSDSLSAETQNHHIDNGGLSVNQEKSALINNNDQYVDQSVADKQHLPKNKPNSPSEFGMNNNLHPGHITGNEVNVKPQRQQPNGYITSQAVQLGQISVTPSKIDLSKAPFSLSSTIRNSQKESEQSQEFGKQGKFTTIKEFG